MKSQSALQRLISQTHLFGFFQGVRLIERAAILSRRALPLGQQKVASKPIALYSPPDAEILRFKSYQSLTFPGSDIFSVKSWQNATGITQWAMTVSFIGVTGSMGVLPYHYTETILQRLRLKDESMLRFFDLFNHRTVSLFYQAGAKYSLPIEYERKKLISPLKQKHDTATHALLSLAGFGTNYLSDSLHIREETLAYFSGLLSQKVRTGIGLKHMIQHQFGIPVHIQEFVGQRQALIEDVRSRLRSKAQPKGQNVCLGRSVMLGQHGWFAQGKIRIILGPLNNEQVKIFAPGTNALKALNELVRIYVGMEIEYDYVVRVNRKDIPERVKLSSKTPAIMGWNTWLSDNALGNKHQEHIDIKISTNRL